MDSSRENKQLDELFKSKLERHQTPVGEELWDRLNKERHSKAGSVWYERKLLAAAVVAAVVAAGGIWLGFPAGRDTFSASESGEVSGIPQKAAYENLNIPRRDSAGPEYAMAPGASDRTFPDVAKVVSEAGDMPAGVTIKRKKNLKGLYSESVVPPIGESTRETVQDVAAAVISAEKETKAETEAKQEQDGGRVLVVYVRPPVSRVDAVPEKPAYELTAVAEIDENKAAEGRKKLSFRRFFKQLKNAKTGEKIDWEELGLNPQRVFANVDHYGGEQAGGQ